uniref:Syntaxin, Qa-SNARE family n=1 Tax=Parastrongyloides trichosuri TaxID=131310 RepID=A0A0N4ZU58_PARTI
MSLNEYTILKELSTSLNLDVINTSMVNLNNKKETLIKIDCFLNVHNIKNVIQNLKNNNILEIDILQQYVKIFIKVMKSLKDQKSREMRSFSDTNIVTKSKKIDKNFYFKQEFTQFLKQNGTLFDSSKDKLSPWSMIKKRLLRNSEGKNNNSLLLINKRNKSSKGSLKNSSSSISLGSINVYKEEKMTKCWPSDYNKLLKYVEGEMNILFDVYDDYKGVIKKTKVLLSKKQEFRKNVTLSKVFIPNSIKEKYLSTFQKRTELSLNYDKLQKLQLSDSTINNIKKFITYTDLLENTKFRLSKLELLFHQYEIRIIRLFIKINAMHEELLGMNDTYSLTN